MKILIDIDGVTVDFVSKILERLNKQFGTEIKHEHITEWDFFSNKSTFELLTEEQKKFTRDLMCEEGFAGNVELMPHVKETLEALVKNGCEVVWLTAPWNSSKTWVEDRTKHIHETLGHISKNIIFEHNKEEIEGDLLIDDRPENLLKWIEKNYKGHKSHAHQVLLFKQPWNEKLGEKHSIPFLNGWKDKKLSHTVLAHRIFR